jgi:antitoxin ParD1/3/4
MNVSLTPELEAFVRAKVDGGRYNNASEVVRDALRRMETEDRLYEEKLAALRREVQKGLDDAEAGRFSSKSVEEIIEEGKRRRRSAAAE